MNRYEILKNRTVEQVAEDILNDGVHYGYCDSKYCPHAANPNVDCDVDIIPSECKKAAVRYLLSEPTKEQYNPSCCINILYQERSGEPLNCNSCNLICGSRRGDIE